MFRSNLGFRTLVFNTLVFDCGAWLVSPLYIIFFVRELGASDGWLGLNGMLASIGGIIGHLLWRRWIRRLGYSRALLLSAPLGASYACLLGLFPSLTLILVWGMLNNIINPGISLSHFNLLLKVAPDDRRPTYMATYSTLANIGAFIMPLVGVALAGAIDIRPVLLIGGTMRLAGSFLFYIFRIRVQESEIL
jgi:MFS family permease